LKLSVLICNTHTRVKNFLPVIVEELTRQAEGKDVEVLWLGDNKKRSLGEKRNNLIDLAKGEYICFVDDDDRVSYDYISLILSKLEKNPDLVTFQAYRNHNGKKDRIVMYDMRYPKDENKVGRYQRVPNHLMVWKKSKIKDIRFIPSNYGEDSDWAVRVKAHANIKLVQEIKKILYFYDFNQDLTETQKF
jgi:glycosyltransferase involved in cell wall biosynthesis